MTLKELLLKYEFDAVAGPDPTGHLFIQVWPGNLRHFLARLGFSRLLAINSAPFLGHIDLVPSISYGPSAAPAGYLSASLLGAKRRQCGWYCFSGAFLCERKTIPEHQGAQKVNKFFASLRMIPPTGGLFFGVD